jgi:hypothetical protein
MTIDILIDKTEDFRLMSQKDKVKRFAYFYKVLERGDFFTAKDIEDLFKEARMSPPSNIHDVIGKILIDKSKDIIKTGGKYSLERHFVKQMDAIYLKAQTAKVEGEMADLLNWIKNMRQKAFLEDAIKCINAHIHRPAIIMMWLLTMDVLYEFVINNKLVEFNSEIKRRNIKHAIATKSDFEDIKESIFIEVLRSCSIISKEQKKILDEKLDIRNSAAHPNQTSFKEAKVISFVEELMVDIVETFQ